MNAANKKYSHHLGVAGYKKSVKKWQKMEQDLMDRGIRPTTWDWKIKGRYCPGKEIQDECLERVILGALPCFQNSFKKYLQMDCGSMNK